MSRDLPAVTSPLPRDLQQFVQRVREALDSGGDDAVVTARQLIVAESVSASYRLPVTIRSLVILLLLAPAVKGIRLGTTLQFTLVWESTGS